MESVQYLFISAVSSTLITLRPGNTISAAHLAQNALLNSVIQQVTDIGVALSNTPGDRAGQRLASRP